MRSAARYDVIFSTDRFNLSVPREYFINDCCFGDDVAQWLVERLRGCGVSASEPGQEDWGWYFDARHGDWSYFVGVGGNADEEPARSNRGEWRLIVEKHRTLWEKLTGANLIGEDDAFLRMLKETLASEPGFRLVGV